MNRRQFKKACKRAREEIRQRWPEEFARIEWDQARGDESVYSPPGYEPTRQEGRTGNLYTDAPKGSWGSYIRTSYEYDEWDWYTALDLLWQLRVAYETDWDALAAEMEEAA